jgi:hypothetical protein
VAAADAAGAVARAATARTKHLLVIGAALAAAPVSGHNAMTFEGCLRA